MPQWLKSLRLHKYTSLFQQISYDEMLGLTEEQLESQGVTKGARHKMVVCVRKLLERTPRLLALERELDPPDGPARLRPILGELRAIAASPIRPFPPPGRPEPYQSRIDGLDLPPDQLDVANLPAHFTRVLGKLATTAFAATAAQPEHPAGHDLFPALLHLLDRCLNHEAFTQAQKRRILNWKQLVKRVWHPPHRRPPPPPPPPHHPAFFPGRPAGPSPLWKLPPIPDPHSRLFFPQPPNGRWLPPPQRQQPPTYAQDWQFDAKSAGCPTNPAAYWQMLSRLQAALPSGSCHSGGPPPPFRSVQEMASALAFLTGALQTGGQPPQPPKPPGGCNGACTARHSQPSRAPPAAPAAFHQAKPPPPPPPQPAVSQASWSDAGWSGAPQQPRPISGGSESAWPRQTERQTSGGGTTVWGSGGGSSSSSSGLGSPVAFNFGASSGLQESDWETAGLSSRMEHLCRSVAEVALVEQITNAAVSNSNNNNGNSGNGYRGC